MTSKPELLLTVLSLGLASLLMLAGACLVVLSDARQRGNVISGVLRLGLLTAMLILTVVAVDVLIGRTHPASLFF